MGRMEVNEPRKVSKYLIFLLIIFVLFNFFDTITTLKAISYVSSGETNPIFVFLPNIFLGLLIKWVMVTVIVIYTLFFHNYFVKYKDASEFQLFVLLSSLIIITYVLGYASYNNYLAGNALEELSVTNPAVFEEYKTYADSISAAEKISVYVTIIKNKFVIPFLLGLISFGFYTEIRNEKVIKWKQVIKWRQMKKKKR